MSLRVYIWAGSEIEKGCTSQQQQQCQQRIWAKRNSKTIGGWGGRVRVCGCIVYILYFLCDTLFYSFSSIFFARLAFWLLSFRSFIDSIVVVFRPGPFFLSCHYSVSLSHWMLYAIVVFMFYFIFHTYCDCDILLEKQYMYSWRILVMLSGCKTFCKINRIQKVDVWALSNHFHHWYYTTVWAMWTLNWRMSVRVYVWNDSGKRLFCLMTFRIVHSALHCNGGGSSRLKTVFEALTKFNIKHHHRHLFTAKTTFRNFRFAFRIFICNNNLHRSFRFIK